MQDLPHELAPPIAEIGSNEDQTGDQIGTPTCRNDRRGGGDRGTREDRRTSAERIDDTQEVGCDSIVTIAVEVCGTVAMPAKIDTGDAKSGRLQMCRQRSKCVAEIPHPRRADDKRALTRDL